MNEKPEDVIDRSAPKVRVKRGRRRIYEAAGNQVPSEIIVVKEQEQRTEAGLQGKIREADARHIMKNHVLCAMGAGLIPAPFMDAAAVFGVQLNMLYRLSGHYGIEFFKNRAKALIASLIGSLGPAVLAGGAFGMLIKAVPGLGSIIGSVKMPFLSGAATYAIGMVFIQHFESGGTFLDFDPDKVRDYYDRQFREGKKIVSEPENIQSR